jgi:16S rRNA (uracil1498-N3)-methyltransferase
MQLFYSPDITPGSLCTLDPEESRHAVRVLRLRQGDPIAVTDGRGALYHCTILEPSDKACVVEAINSEFRTQNSELKIHLAVAPTKNPSRMEWLVEKAVEMGVGEITLLQCDHSERTFLKTERLHKIALSAMKQSLHLTLPRINPAVELKEWLNSSRPTPHPSIKLIAHCEADQPRTPLGEALKPGQAATMLIGPEGDFSPEEIALALQCGFQPVSLGSSRLRTETAALYAVAAFNFINDKS